jgi:carnitine-CoA ligase
MTHVDTEPFAAEDIRACCTGRIPAFAIRRFARFATQIPKTQSEKVRKAEIREVGVTPDTFDRMSAVTG